MFVDNNLQNRGGQMEKQTFFKTIDVNNLTQKKVEIDKKGGNISSDGGLFMFASLDKSIGYTKSLSRCMQDTRQEGKVKHTIEDIIKQKVMGLIAGYEDQNDHNQLRHDDMMKVCVGKEDPLASQPTISRFENVITVQEIIAMSYMLVDLFVKRRKKVPKEIVLDIDPTDAETHGGQQGTLFHGFYMQYQYYPLLVFCEGICLGALLRKGTAGANRYAYSMISRIVDRIRMHWPEVKISLRGDCGFGNPKMFTVCEKKGLTYVLGKGGNTVLYKEVEALEQEVERDFMQTECKQRRFTSFVHQAQTWPEERTVIAKVERNAIGINRRFVVISGEARVLTEEESRTIYDDYVQRGAMEVHIGEWKNALNADRMSCCSFKANWFRLLLHTAAYNLMYLVKQLCENKIQEIAQGSLSTMRLYLIKIGAVIRLLKTRIKIHLSSSFPHIDVFWNVCRLTI